MSKIGTNTGVSGGSNYVLNSGYVKKTGGSKDKSSHVSGENPLKKLKPMNQSDSGSNYKNIYSNLKNNKVRLKASNVVVDKEESISSRSSVDFDADSKTVKKPKVGELIEKIDTQKSPKLTSTQGKAQKSQKNADSTLTTLLGPKKAWMADHFDAKDIKAVKNLLNNLNFNGARGDTLKYLLVSKLPKAIQEIRAKYPEKAIDKIDIKTWIKFLRIEVEDYLGNDSTLHVFDESPKAVSLLGVVLVPHNNMLEYNDDSDADPVPVYSLKDKGDPEPDDLNEYLRAGNDSGRMNRALRLKLAIDCYDTQVRPLRTGRHVPSGINHIPTKKEFLDILMGPNSKGGKVKTWAEGQLQKFQAELKLGVSYDCNLLRLKYNIPAKKDGTLKNLKKLTPAQATALLRVKGEVYHIRMAEDGESLLYSAKKEATPEDWYKIDKDGNSSSSKEEWIDIGKCGKSVDVNIVNKINFGEDDNAIRNDSNNNIINSNNNIININNNNIDNNNIDNNSSLNIESKFQKLPTKRRPARKIFEEEEISTTSAEPNTEAKTVLHPTQDFKTAVLLDDNGWHNYGADRYPNVSFWLGKEKLDIGRSSGTIQNKVIRKGFTFAQYRVFMNYLHECRKANLKENKNLGWNDIQVSASKVGQDMKVKVLIPFLRPNTGGRKAYSTRIDELTVDKNGFFTVARSEVDVPAANKMSAGQLHALNHPNVMYKFRGSHPSFDRYNMAEDGRTILCSYANSQLPQVAILPSGTIVSLEDYKSGVRPTQEQYKAEAGFGTWFGRRKLAWALGLKWNARGTLRQVGPHRNSRLQGYEGYLESTWTLNGVEVGTIRISPKGALSKVG